MFGLYLLPGAKFLKPLGFFCNDSHKGVFCYVNKMTFGKLPRRGVSCQWQLENWNFQHPTPPWKGRGSGDFL